MCQLDMGRELWGKNIDKVLKKFKKDKYFNDVGKIQLMILFSPAQKTVIQSFHEISTVYAAV
jgi:hypothetical protein